MSNHSSLKRKFVPTQISDFNKAKKFKLNTQTGFSTQTSLNCSYQSSQFELSSSIPGQFNPTVPQPFNLQTQSRTRKSWTIPTEDLKFQIIQNRPKFKAKAVPKFPPGPVPIKTNFFTVPQEFNFLAASKCKNFSNPPIEKFGFTAKPCPDFSKRFEIKKNQGGFTVPQPFNLETAERMRNIEGFGRFEALPLPGFYSQDESRPRSRAESGDVQGYKFTARPMPSFEKVFAPVMNSVSTQPIAFELSTEKRAEDREKFEETLRDKENYLKELKELEKKIEEETVKNFRKTLEFKARPLQDLKPFFINRSEEELTSPKSPVLRTKFRAQQRSENKSSLDMDID